MAGAAPSILFIGNSFTMGDYGTASIPDIFYALSEAGGHTNVTVAMSAVGGTDYRYHSTNTDAQATIAAESWTHVILQDYSTEPTHYVDGVHSIANFMTYGTDLYHEIMAVPGPHLVLLFETWSRSAANPLITGTDTTTSFSSTGEFQYELRTNYYHLANTLNAANPTNPLVAVAPVGDAWQNAGGLLPSSDTNFTDLYYNGDPNPYYDGYHGDDNGYYLAAAVFYARIYGESPEGLHTNTAVANLGLNLTVSPEFLESNAWATVLAQPQTPIRIAENPASQTVAESNAVTFEALVEGSPPYYAQWFTNNVPIPGANSLSYHLNSVSTNLNGTEFAVVVSNDTSSATSQLATLTVESGDPAPQITNAVVQLNENSPAGTEVYDVNDAQTGTDQEPNGTNLTYSITAGNNGGAFAIDAATGIITVNNSATLNYQIQPSYSLTVSASDGTLTDTAQITVNLTPDLPAFLIDFGADETPTSHGAAPDNDPSNYWNNITPTIGTDPGGQLDGLVTTSNKTTAVNLVMLSRFSGRNPDGTIASSVYPANATRDSLFGNTEDYQGLSNVFPSFKLTGLDTNESYNLTFYASRLDASDNRETKYTASGSSSGFVTLNPVSNVDNTVTLQGMRPSAGGEITVSIAPGANNNNAYHFTYLGVMRVEASATADIEIVKDPVSQTVIESNGVTFEVSVLGSPPYYAQWYTNGVSIPGANTLSYHLDSVSTNLSGTEFSVVVSNDTSHATSQPATLTVVSADSAPQITNAVVQLDEHSPVGTEVYDVNDARTGTDQEPDGTNLIYSITAGNSGGAFAIDAATGIITVSNSAALNYDTQPSFYLTVSASNGIVADTAQITVNLNKVNEIGKLGVAFLIDFGADASTTSYGAAPDNDPSNYWNNITTTIGTDSNGQIDGLVTTSNLMTAVNLVMLSPFNGANLSGTAGSSVYPANATKDSLFGNTENFQGESNVFPSFKLTGLDTNASYNLTFYASRLDASDNRETKYTVSGSSSGFVTLNPVNNEDNTATLRGMRPSAGGEITVGISPGANNTNSYHFTYLGVLRVEVAKSNAVVTLDDLTQTYDGSAKVVSVTTDPTNLPVSVTYDGSPDAPINAGSYQVIATVTDPNYSGAATNTLVIAPVPALVTLTNLNQQYDGTGKFVLAQTTPTNLTVALTYDGSAILPTNAGSYAVVGTVVDPNYFGSASNTLVIAQAPALVTLTNLNQQYDGTGKSVLAETSPTNLTVALTYNGSAILPTNAGSYQVVGTVVDANYFGGATNTLSITKVPALVTLTNLTQQYDGTGKSVLAETSPTNLTVALTYDGSAILPTNAGSYEVVGTVVDTNYFGSATNTLVIAQAPALVTLTNLNQQYDGTGKFVLAETTPTNLTVALTYDGSAILPTNAGSYEVVGTVVDTNYFGSATNTLVIEQAPALVTLTNLNQEYDGTGKSVLAETSPTNLTVALTYDGSAILPTNAGSYEVVGMVVDTNYFGSATNTLVIEQAPALVTLTNLNQQYDGTGKFVLALTTPTNLTVALTYDGSAILPTNAGSYEVVGTVVDTNYFGSATNTLVIAQAPALVTLTNLNQEYDGTGKFVLAETTPTNLTVALTYDGSAILPTNASSYEVVGTVVDTNYFGSATNTLVITQAPALVTLTNLNQEYDGTGKFVLAETTPTNLTVALTYDGSATLPTNAGSYEVVGTVVDTNYFGSVTNTLVIAQAPALVTLTNLNQQYDGTGKFVLAETTPTNLTVALTYDGSAILPTNAGSYEVVGTVVDTNYFGSATNTLVITQAPALVTLTNLNQQYDGTGKFVLAETTPTNLTVALTYDGSAILPTNAGSYQVVGTVVDTNYFGSATNTLVIAQAPALVTLTNLNQQYDGTGKFVLAETTPTNLTVALTYDGSATLPTNAGSYQVVGTVVDTNYFGSATNTLVIAQAPALVALTNLNQQYDGTGKFVLAETTPTNLTVALTYDGSAILPTNAGSYEVVGTVVDTNYFGSATNTLVIEQAPALVTLTNLNQQYDGTGKFVLAETTPTNLTVALTYDGSAILPTNAGSYEVVGTVVDTNYFGAVTNTLLISRRPLTITADDKSKVFGSPDPVFTATYDGFATNENKSVLEGTLVFSRQPGESVGIYTITPSGLSSSNYDISFLPGSLTITPVAVPVILSLEVVDGTNVVITWSAVSNVTYLVRYRNELNSGNWIPLAPEVTATNSTASFVDHPGNQPQRFYQVVVPDSQTLTSIPAPVILRLDGVNTTNLVITWSAVTNVIYRVRYRNELNSGNWIPLTPDVTATNSTASAIDHPDNQSHRFYQVVVP